LRNLIGWKAGRKSAGRVCSEAPTNRHFVVDLVRHCGHRRVAEVGVWKGHLSRMLLSECDLDHLLLVDPLQLARNLFVPRTRSAHPSMMAPGTYHCTMGEPTLSQDDLDRVHAGLVAELEAGHPGKTRFLRLPSLEAALLVPDRSFDLVFIDAIHLYEDVLADVHAWLPKVKEGGTLAGDDYSPAFQGVIDAVNELFPVGIRHVHETGVWYVHKRDLPRSWRNRRHHARLGSPIP
jgi:hypothetical protein